MTDEQIMRDLQVDLLVRIKAGEKCGPFEAAIYDRAGTCIATATNSVELNNCSHNHAEMNVIRLVEEKFGTWNLAPRNLVLYTTSEPCMMCMGGILWSGIRKVVYGVPSDRVRRLPDSTKVLNRIGNRNSPGAESKSSARLWLKREKPSIANMFVVATRSMFPIATDEVFPIALSPAASGERGAR